MKFGIKLINFTLLIIIFKNNCLAEFDSISFFNNFEKEQKVNYSYLLRINYPKNISKIPKIYGYYKGYKLEFEGDFCVINQKKQTNQFVLVLTPQVNYKLDGRNIQYLERVKDQPCKMYFIKAQLEQNSQTVRSWHFEEEKVHTLPISLPMDALVVLMNPDHIKGLKNENKNSEKIDSTIFRLPNIIINDKISSSQINKTSIQSLLASLDNDFIHVPVKKSLRTESDKIISIKEMER